MTLEADEFLRRFLLHVLPRGFVKTAKVQLHSACAPQRFWGSFKPL